MISFGGGVNSVALTILLLERGFADSIVFADTLSEHPETYTYLEYFNKFLEKKYQTKVLTISPHSFPHLYGTKARGKSIEMFVLRNSVLPDRLRRWCTHEWKIRPIANWRRLKNDHELILGIDYGERSRAEGRTDAKFPLIDLKIDRAECEYIIRHAGLEVPEKSGCWFCIFQRFAGWKHIFLQHNELWIRARNMELAAQRRVTNSKRISTLRPDGISLAEMELSFLRGGNGSKRDCNFDELTPCQCIL